MADQLQIYSKSNSGLLFKFSKNQDGTFFILPKTSNDKSLVEVINSGFNNGNNIQIWECTNNLCLKWNL